MSQLVLIIDDEPDIRELLDITLRRMDIDCQCAENLSSARSLLNKHNFDLCLTDMKLPDGNGVDFVSELQSDFPGLPVAVITAHGSMDAAIQAMKNGAFDFLTKPVDLNSLRNIVEDALRSRTVHDYDQSRLIGECDSIRKLRKTIDKVSRSQAPIYISGESGTGKELVAHLIHDSGPRSGKAFVPINCGAIPEDLMESEFFGHKKGSFTGAVADKQGLFQAADEGTLFLDEIAELPQHMQVKLLRVLQEKVVRPIGSQEEIPVNVRILSATNCDLVEQVEKGLFRQDLMFRINVIEIRLSTLRERKEDLPLLIDHILEKISLNSGESKPIISKDAMQVLQNYDYPGNIRELENILERASTLCSNNTIDMHDISLPETKTKISGGEQGLDTMLSDMEKQKILQALEKTKWNKTAAAKLLGISFRALRYRLEKLNLE